MREIKFRGLTLNGDWVYGLFSNKMHGIEIDFGYYISNSKGVPFAFKIRPETLGQYTGLKDRNGVEVFEGDILKICNGSINGMPWWEKNREIRFNEASFNVTTWSFDSTHWFEVIGNIHQNKELL